MEISEEAKLTTVQSALLLSFEYSHNSMDKIAYTFVQQAVTLSEQIGLFRADVHSRIRNGKMRAAREYTAWGLYCWIR